MRKNLIIMLIFSCVLFAACLEDKRPVAAANQAETVDTVKTENKDTTKQAIDSSRVEKDSVVTTLEASLPEKPTEVHSSEKTDNGVPLWGIIALTLGAGSLLMVIVLWYRTSLMYKNICYELEHLEHEDDRNMAGISKRLIDSQKEATNYIQKLQMQYDDLLKRMDIMGEKVNKNLSNSQNDTSVKARVKKSDKEVKPNLKTGYFGVVKTGNGLAMFNDYPKSRNEDAYFEMTYLDDTHCEFAPFDLDRIRAIDDITSAVDYTGSMPYAKEMKVLASGKAEFNSERNFWKITDKAKIELL